MLFETASPLRLWGTFLFRTGPALPVAVEIPRPVIEFDTLDMGFWLFEHLHARAMLWPGAKTVADVRRAYEAKVPMGRGCTTADVMIALYYIMAQTYETGQAVPVTGGQVMLS